MYKQEESRITRSMSTYLPKAEAHGSWAMGFRLRLPTLRGARRTKIGGLGCSARDLMAAADSEKPRNHTALRT